MFLLSLPPQEEPSYAAVTREIEHIWARVQAHLATVVDDSTYRTWLEPLRALELDAQRLVIETPEHSYRWIQDRFGRLIAATVRLELDANPVIELRPHPGGARPRARDAQARQAGARTTAPDEHAFPTARISNDAGLLVNPKLTFDQFVIGDCNRLAHAAALSVAEMPTTAYNPLFIYGPPGVGKTHLLSAIAALLLAHDPTLTVRTTTGEAFTNEFIAAISGGRTENFKLRFRDIDVLLIDDVQFLERKTKTEEEFFHTFNALHDSGRQVVLTSDRPPHDLQALEDRLRERFQAGLVADIKPPEHGTRMAILRKRVHQDHIDLQDEEALTVIADRVRNNVRSLEGALIRVVAYGSLTGRPITPELAEEVLSSLYPDTRRAGQTRRSVADIQAATCRHFELSSDELLSSTRAVRITWPRQVAMYLARELSGESLPAIGRHFGGRDHTTVLHAWKRASKRIADDERARIAVDKLRSELEAPPQ